MKTIDYLSMMVIGLILSACANTISFPVSTIAPAAVGTASFNKDKNNNYIVNVKVKYLTSADRLTPSKSIYVVWIKSDKGDIKNIGQLISDKNNNATMTGISSSKPVQIFISAEDKGDVSWPSNQELFRIQNIALK